MESFSIQWVGWVCTGEESVRFAYCIIRCGPRASFCVSCVGALGSGVSAGFHIGGRTIHVDVGGGGEEKRRGGKRKRHG